jgi:hypothetical protein
MWKKLGNENLKATILITEYDGTRTNGKCEMLQLLDSMITNDARCTREIKYRTVKAKAAFNKKTLFTSKLDLNLRKNTSKCYTWKTALYGAANWTLREVDQK